MVRGVEKIARLLPNGFQFVHDLRDSESGGEDGRYCRGRDGTSVHGGGDVEKVDPAQRVKLRRVPQELST
jgi:hypothetical protein